MSTPVALIDLDGTVADYDGALRAAMAPLAAPGEPPFLDRADDAEEPPHIHARRKLIQARGGFWRDLAPLGHGMSVVDVLRRLGFDLHVLTKGPRTTPSAWTEKVEWCAQHLPDALVHISSDKSLVYGRVLVDDWPPYFEGWLERRPRGLVVCVAHPWNAAYAPGGPRHDGRVVRYDGNNFAEVTARLALARERD